MDIFAKEMHKLSLDFPLYFTLEIDALVLFSKSAGKPPALGGNRLLFRLPFLFIYPNIIQLPAGYGGFDRMALSKYS